MSEIRIYTDESVDVAIAQGLQRRGWGSSLRLTFGILQEESNVDLTPNLERVLVEPVFILSV
jgi:hypothetical protein